MADLTASHWGALETVQGATGLPELRPHRDDPDPSPIGMSMLDAYQAGPRILRPAVRRSWLEHGPGASPELRGREAFVEVSWDEAERLVAYELQRVIDKHGNASIFGGCYGWASAGRFHHAQSQWRRFIHHLGGCTVHSQTYSYAAAEVLLPHVVAPMTDLKANHTAWSVLAQHTGLFVSFGGAPWKNAQVASGGAFEHRLRGGLDAMVASGCRFVNFSPVRSDLELPDAALEWIPIRPNADTAVMLALACEIILADRHDRAFLAKYCVGFEVVLAYLLGGKDGVRKDAQWAAGIADVPAARLRELALDMSARTPGRRCMLNAAWALQRGDHGEQAYWALVTLASVIGQIGLPGGGFGVGYGSENSLGSPHRLLDGGPRVPFPANPIGSVIPVARISDMLLRPNEPYEFNGRSKTYPDIHLVYWVGGNPFHHHQDLHRLRLAWRKPQTVIVHEQAWNALAKHADIVLPASASVERDDIAYAPREQMVLATKTVVPTPGQARDDYAIFAGIAERMGFGETFTEGRTPLQWQAHLWETWRAGLKQVAPDMPDFERFRAQGQWRIAPLPGQSEAPPVMLANFRRDPQAHPLNTPSGRIELFSETIKGFAYPECPPHASWIEPNEWLGSSLTGRYPLHLITDQPATRLHSQLDFSSHSRASKVAGREPIWMHPDDARARAITPGDVVRVFNDRGSCLAGAVLTGAMRLSVVKISTGAWLDLQEDGEGALCKHGNPNVLTRDSGTSRLAQGSSAQSCLVQVVRWEGLVPPVAAFDLPNFVTTDARAAALSSEKGDLNA